MARRKADWSIIDAQMKARDSQDRQGRFSAPYGQSPDRLRERTGSAYSEKTYSQVDAPTSPGIRRPEHRGGWGNVNIEREYTIPRRRASREATRSGSGTRPASTQASYREADRSGIRAARDSRIARTQREQKAYNTRETYRAADAGIMRVQEEASHRAVEQRLAATRQQRQDYRTYGAADEGMNLSGLIQEDRISSRKRDSTIQAYHAADSAPLKDYKPRGKVVTDKKTNIQAFY